MIPVAASSKALFPTNAASRDSAESRRAGERSVGIRQAPKPVSAISTESRLTRPPPPGAPTITATALDAAATLHAATMGGAQALGLTERIGSLEAGKQADIICVAMDALETQPMYHPISQLVYSTGRHQVRDVWIAGQRKLADGELLDVDVPSLLARVGEWRQRIAAVRKPT